MTPDDLDRILSADEVPAPSAAFARNVMAAVQREAAEPARPRFPWIRFATGVTASLVMAAAGASLLAQTNVAAEVAYATAAVVVSAGLAAVPRLLFRP